MIAALCSVLLFGCREKPPTSTKQVPQTQLRQAERGDALLKAAARQLNDLPAAIDTELRAPVVILDSRKSIGGKDVLATCMTNPRSPDGLINVIHVPAGNSGFRNRVGVQPGDILKYYVLEDKTVDPESQRSGMSRQVAMELNVAQVLDDNTLTLENGLNQEVTEPRKIEIWRYAEERIHEIHEKLVNYQVYRLPPIAWETAPDEQVLTQVMAWLNQWIRQSDPKTDWQRDSLLLDTLDAKLREDKEMAVYLKADSLSARAFPPEDSRFLQEALWIRDISRWSHGDSFDDVSRATSLFDWTVRNIQLERDDDEIPHRPWQTLLYSRGTVEQRALVFALLCRQQGMDVVMLALPPAVRADGKSPPVPADAKFWLSALISEGQLYLFDSRLGLPIPGPGGKGVATLDQLRKNDSLLRQLDIEGAAYPITGGSLNNIEANIVADPFSLSRRASQLATSLSGDERAVLAVKPSELAVKVKSISGIAAIRLWEFPFQTLRDQLSLGKSARQNEALEFEPFALRPALWKARMRHFQGRRQESNANGKGALGEATDDHMEAARYYLSNSVRPPAREIAESSDDKRRIDSTAKLNAAYWVGLLSLDDGKYSVAASWLARPELLDASSPWAFGANYNLARALEAQSKFEEAIALLERDTSPQQHGNKLRARALKVKAKAMKKKE